MSFRLLVFWFIGKIEKMFASSRSHVGQQELDKLGMLSVKDRVTQLKLNHVYKIFHNKAPDYMCYKFIKVSDMHNHSTRDSTTNFVVPTMKGPECNRVFLYWDF